MITPELLGWISSICFTLAGLPQVVRTIKERHAEGFSAGFLILWFLGNVFGALFAYSTQSTPLLIGFCTSVIFGLVIWKYKIQDLLYGLMTHEDEQ